MPPTISVCADDYAISPAVSQGILELLDAGRLSATSCVVTTPFWPEAARDLRLRVADAEVGLHLTFGTTPLRTLLGDADRVRWLIDDQLDAFEEAMDGAPHFVDGHRHVHLLPSVARVLVEALTARHWQRHVWVRTTVEPLPWIARRAIAPLKAAALAQASLPLAGLLRRAGVATNDSFRGVNGFTSGPRVGALFRRFLRGPGARPLLMCHPGRVDAALAAVDRVTRQREHELAYLAGPEFPHDLEAAGRRLGPLRLGAVSS